MLPLNASRFRMADENKKARNSEQPSRRQAHIGTLTPLEREFLPHVLEIQETPPSPIQRKVIWTIMVLIAVLVTWAYFGKLSIVATASGKFIPNGRIKHIQPLESSVIKAIHVQEGQRVKTGDLLLELDPTINAAEYRANEDKYAFNHAEQVRLYAELTHSPVKADVGDSKLTRLEDNVREARESAHAAKIAEAQAAVEEKTQAVAAARATLKKYEETTAIAQEREASARPLVDTGAISRLDYLQLQQDLVSNQNDLAAQVKIIDQAEAAKAEAVQKLAGIERDRVTEIYNDLNQKITAAPSLKGDLDKAKQLYALKWLRAPVDGLVQKVDVTTIGAVVTPAQNLVTIVPENTPLIVEAMLSNEDIGYVRYGQPVDIKVDTFPFQKYGTLKGKLIWISPDAEEKNGEDSSSPAVAKNDSKNGADSYKSAKSSGYMYKIHVEPEQTTFIVSGKKVPIQPGMSVQAEVITDHRKIIEFFLSPIVKYLDEGLKVR